MPAAVLKVATSDSRKERVRPAVTKRPKQLVHYTDHTCRVADATAPALDWNKHRSIDKHGYKAFRTRGGDLDYDGKPTPPRWITGGDDRIASWGACNVRGRRLHDPVDPARHGFSTDRALVTCERCLGTLADRDGRDAARPAGGLIVTDTLRQIDAWEGCCKERGCASPAVDRSQACSDLAAERRQWLSLVMERILGEAKGLVAAQAVIEPAGAGSLGGPEMSPAFDRWLDELEADVPGPLLESMRPVLHDIALAVHAAEQAAFVVARAMGAGHQLVERMRAGQLDVAPTNDERPAALRVRAPRQWTAVTRRLAGAAA